MYLKEHFIRFLKIKNVLFLIIGIFLASMSVAIIIELIVYYFGDWYTILTARSMPESVFFIFFGAFLIVCSRISRRLINDAGFYSSYFETSLSGYISCHELSAVTGKSVSAVTARLHLLRPLYMKCFSFRSQNGYEYVELFSKTCVCECRQCGAPIEKRLYFTGVCPYCRGSDLFAKVISGNRFYSISGAPRQAQSSPAFYEGRALTGKKIGFTAGLCAVLILCLVFLLLLTDMISKYNNQEYLTKVLLSGKSYSSFDLIRAEMMNTIIFAAFSFVALGSAVPLLVARLASVIRSERYAKFFARFPFPYISMQQLSTEAGSPARALRNIIKSLRERHLRNCSPDQQTGELRISLAKQITKDTCPYCGAPIVGAISENHCCSYCRRLIMGVIRKQ
ncbi:MAG: hypothetical protein ABS876_00960 [Ruminococcus sp.]